jgi:thiol-disulfide isomerase/thioredoxin
MVPSTVEKRKMPAGRGRLLVALLSLCLLLPAMVHARPPGEVRTGELLRDAWLDGLNGPSRRLADYRGRPLLINVWASWCGPCRMEMASLERLAWREGRLPFAMIGISTDDYPDRARAVLERSNATISHFIDHSLAMETMLGADHIPLTVLVDADGRVLRKVYGAREWDAPDSLQLIARTFGAKKAAAR